MRSETPLVFGNEYRLETALTVTGHFYAERPFPCDHRLGALAVALFVRFLGFGSRGVPQVVLQFSTHCPLNQRLLEGQRGSIDRLGAHRARHKLVDQLLGYPVRAAMASFFSFVLLGIRDPLFFDHGMPQTQNLGQARRALCKNNQRRFARISNMRKFAMPHKVPANSPLG